MKLRFSKSKILGIFIALSVLGGISYYYAYQFQQPAIREFNEQRDTEFVLKVFNENWYWLTSKTKEEYDTDLLVKHRSTSKDPQLFGNLTIKVYFENDNQAGFIAYYKKKFYEGVILFLAVDQEFRGKGYGETMLRYAVDDLFTQGCTIVTLVTRTENYPAHNIYKRVGFHETWHDEIYMYFAIEKPKD